MKMRLFHGEVIEEEGFSLRERAMGEKKNGENKNRDKKHRYWFEKTCGSFLRYIRHILAEIGF
jgi:hypothetical protein